MDTKQDSTGEFTNRAGTITKISFQKKKTDRRSVFIDGKYAFSISEQTFSLFPLQVDQELSEKQITIIKNHEEFEKAKEHALRYIAIRMRSEFEIKTYLRKKECKLPVINRVIQYCFDRGYLDDGQYAAMLTRDMININRYGKRKMYAILRKRGIAPNTISRVLSEQVDERGQINIAQKLAEKKLQTIKEPAKAREKLFRYLKQRGFNYSTIAEVINRLLKH